jgi:hypothetical protein
MPKVYMDEYAAEHVSDRIRKRFQSNLDRSRLVEVIKQMLTLDAPNDAVGEYRWYVNVGMTGRVICRGHMVRTVLSYNENFPGGTEYKISAGELIKP